MPVRRATTEILALRGSLDRGNRAVHLTNRQGEPKPRAELDPTPPAHLHPDVQEVWKEIIKIAHLGTLCDSDAIVVETLANTLHKCRTRNWDVAPAILSCLMKCLGQLGMTPADRSRVQQDKSKLKPDEDPFAKFKNKAA